MAGIFTNYEYVADILLCFCKWCPL